MTEIKIVKLDESEPAALFEACYSDGELVPMGVAVSLDLRDGELTVRTTRGPEGGMPESVSNGLVRWYPVPLITSCEANTLLDDLRPIAEQVLNGAEIVWDGNNNVGRLNADAGTADGKIYEFVERFTQDDTYSRVEIWQAADFFAEGDVLDEITASMSDEELVAKGEEFRRNFNVATAGGYVVVPDMLEFLEKVREDKQTDA
jgi:hypothetical protein